MKTLSSNGLPLPFTPDLFAPLRDSTGLYGRPDALRERLASDGYLYLRGVLDRAEVLRLRGAYFSLFDPAYLAPGTTPEEGVFSGRVPAGLPPHGMPGHPAHAFVRSRTFRDFVGSPVLAKLAEAALGGSAELLPRRILRHFHRGAHRASRAHVDLDYLDAGSDRLVTMWIPGGDCPLEAGALVYLEGSHTLRADEYAPLRATSDRPHDRRPITHDLELLATRLGRRWLWADFSAGDVMVHVSRMVHASLDTATDAMRLSIDLRFLPTGAAADPRWLRAWSADDGA
ncbi:phytanoyl-CoA dioxygenase family protein [Streptomyces sp. NPDC003036]|uniref:phytanoyl-CoA dioxygenase family protein n=1 Tax=Streptomyces sp. NPDC003036 TaxID=3154442 RepID=UPI0033B34CD4